MRFCSAFVAIGNYGESESMVVAREIAVIYVSAFHSITFTESIKVCPYR